MFAGHFCRGQGPRQRLHLQASREPDSLAPSAPLSFLLEHLFVSNVCVKSHNITRLMIKLSSVPGTFPARTLFNNRSVKSTVSSTAFVSVFKTNTFHFFGIKRATTESLTCGSGAG